MQWKFFVCLWILILLFSSDPSSLSLTKKATHTLFPLDFLVICTSTTFFPLGIPPPSPSPKFWSLLKEIAKKQPRKHGCGPRSMQTHIYIHMTRRGWHTRPPFPFPQISPRHTTSLPPHISSQIKDEMTTKSIYPICSGRDIKTNASPPRQQNVPKG